MTRTGPEPKPRWESVPRAVRAEVERILGAPIARGSRVYGGYAPSATFRLALADGRRVFFKGVWSGSNDFMRRALQQEERVYRELRDAIRPWAPAFLGSVTVDDWHAILLEDLGPVDTPPWTARKVRDAAREFAAFHAHNESRELPPWVPSWRDLLSGEATMWERIAENGFAALSALAGERAAEAKAWLEAHVTLLNEHASRLHDATPPYTLLYLDARADNVRCPRGRLRIFDWNWVAFGPVEPDVAAFAEGITADGGPLPERFIDAYRGYHAIDERRLDAAVAALAALFARSAPLPERSDLPRLRSVQRRQMKACVAWSARRFSLPPPTWLAAVPD